jgi:hypothetical protein
MGPDARSSRGSVNTNNASSIGVISGSGWLVAPPIGSAIDIGSGGCPDQYGTSFPALLDNTSGDIDITSESPTRT